MAGLLIGYARVSTDAQDLTAQRNALELLRPGVLLAYGKDAMHAIRRDGTVGHIERRTPRFRRIAIDLAGYPVTLFCLTHPAQAGWHLRSAALAGEPRRG